MFSAFYPVHKISTGARETNQFPARHSLITAMDRVTEESFTGIL